MGPVHRRFVVVGGLGFLVDAGLLSLMISAGTGLYAARAVSFPVAVTVTWYFNRIWTFREDAIDRPGREFAYYLIVQVVAALANFVVYIVLLRFVFEERPAMAVPVLIVGAVVGLFINFTGSRNIVFVSRKVTSPRQAWNGDLNERNKRPVL